jgi:hypothetical protein
MYPKSTKIQDSPIHGKGVFSISHIEEGDFIGTALTKTPTDYVQTSLGRHLNHSTSPNIKIIVQDNGNLGIEAISDISANQELLTDYSQFASLMNNVKSAKDHRYVEKREEESGNITYLYTKEHIKARNKKKAKRIQKLSKILDKIQTQIKKDIKSNNIITRMIALAVSLIDETYERIGNTESAEELEHYGVTTWLVKHISFKGGGAIIKYIGKAGVKQEKEIKDKETIKVLKEAIKGKKKNDRIFDGENYLVTGNVVNAYLKKFKITAKDIRGFHANDEMRETLKEVRKKGPKLPSPGKEREKLLKDEFKQALENTAKSVGHKPSTLKNQYLVPGFEIHYLENGSVIKDLTADFYLNIVKQSFPISIRDNFINKIAILGKEILSKLKPYPFKSAWRAESGYSHSKDASALDVVTFEEKELGNDIKVPETIKPLLNHIPANKIVWISSKKPIAARYGTPEKIILGNPLIIGEDGEDGYLIIDLDNI